MTPQIITVTQEHEQETQPQEQFIRQVEDHSLPAQQVLSDQQDRQKPDQAPALFVP